MWKFRFLKFADAQRTWIPAFAGMTVGWGGVRGCESNLRGSDGGMTCAAATAVYAGMTWPAHNNAAFADLTEVSCAAAIAICAGMTQ